MMKKIEAMHEKLQVGLDEDNTQCNTNNDQT